MLRLRNAPGVRHRSFGRPEGLQPWWFPMLYSFRKLSITSTASEFNLIILNPRNEYNTPSKPSGTNGLLEQPLAMGVGETLSAPQRGHCTCLQRVSGDPTPRAPVAPRRPKRHQCATQSPNGVLYRDPTEGRQRRSF